MAQIPKGECIRPGTPLSLEDARRLVEGYVEHYNNVRLNSAIGYITPKGHARRASAGDSGRAGSKVGSGEGTAEESPTAGRVTDETDYFRLADDPAITRHIQFLPQHFLSQVILESDGALFGVGVEVVCH